MDGNDISLPSSVGVGQRQRLSSSGGRASWAVGGGGRQSRTNSRLSINGVSNTFDEAGTSVLGSGPQPPSEMIPLQFMPASGPAAGAPRRARPGFSRTASTIENLAASNQRALDNECAQCHGRAADAVNRPCGHRLLCMPCAVAFRESDGKSRCNVCQAPSKLELLLPKEPELVCVVCCESWTPRQMFVPGDCGHVLCVGCTTQVARDAHGDRTRITAAGLPCGYSGCSTRLGRDVVRTLVAVGRRALPDPRAEHGDPPQPILPLTEEEVATIERFMDEEEVRSEDRAWCPSPSCGRLINLPRTAHPSSVECTWCLDKLCSKCTLPWGRHFSATSSTPSCEGAEASGGASDDASLAFISATSKPCPCCGYSTSHFQGHACHHISPDTNGRDPAA